MEEDQEDGEASPQSQPRYRKLAASAGLRIIVSRDEKKQTTGNIGIGRRSLSVSMGLGRPSRKPLTPSHSDTGVAMDTMADNSSELSLEEMLSSGMMNDDEIPNVASTSSISTDVSHFNLQPSESSECLGLEGRSEKPGSPNPSKLGNRTRSVSINMSKSVSAIAASASNWSVKKKKGRESGKESKRKQSYKIKSFGASNKNWLPGTGEACWRPPLIDDFPELQMQPPPSPQGDGDESAAES